jgi:hypothetical protein
MELGQKKVEKEEWLERADRNSSGFHISHDPVKTELLTTGKRLTWLNKNLEISPGILNKDNRILFSKSAIEPDITTSEWLLSPFIYYPYR